MKLDYAISNYLSNCRVINAFCTQNGWIDSDSLEYEIQERNAKSVVVSVKFTEVIMEGSGCVADRIACFGKLKLDLDHEGKVTGASTL